MFIDLIGCRMQDEEVATASDEEVPDEDPRTKEYSKCLPDASLQLIDSPLSLNSLVEYLIYQ